MFIYIYIYVYLYIRSHIAQTDESVIPGLGGQRRRLDETVGQDGETRRSSGAAYCHSFAPLMQCCAAGYPQRFV